MVAELSDEVERLHRDRSLAVGRLRRAEATLSGSKERYLHGTPTTYSLAQAFRSSEATPLRTYQSASCLREGQLREVVQFLIFSGAQAALVTLRLLTIMEGLPGNWELAMEFLEQQTSESFKSFPARAFSLIALLGGRKAFSLCDWSSVIERASKSEEYEAQWALSALSECVWEGPKEEVFGIHEWETEILNENNPSVWREMKWASYARSLCVNCDVDISFSINGDDTAEHAEQAFESLPSAFGAATPHYIRICGTLVRRRSTEHGKASIDGVHSEQISEDINSGDHFVVLTTSIREVVASMAAYIAYGVPFILEGATGCGKTTLISLLARKTSYHNKDLSRNEDAPGVTFIQMDNTMLHADGESFSSLIGCVVPVPEGGGFQWRPGPIGAAAERGDWIVFENIGRSASRMSSAASIIRKLASARPGDRLEAAGRGEPIVIGRGFRCIATRTVSERDADESWDPPGGWDVWYRIRMTDLSFNEKVMILSERFGEISDCIARVVTVVERVASYTSNFSGPLFRTPTLREAVRICERLKSTRRGSGSLNPESAFLETMDVLAAWCADREHVDELSSIVSLCWSLSPQVGADMYSNHRPDLKTAGNCISIGRACVAKTLLTSQNDFSRLSLTGHTLRLLERTLRCLELGENVLLSGETGCGKTALIQELASLVAKKLIVVNLSRQSELDDLIGGFRPVDSDAAVPLLAKRFESAFYECMSRQKNASFIDALQSASRSLRHHRRALRLMRGALKVIPKSSKRKSPSLWQEWEGIAASLAKLEISVSPEYHINSQLPSKVSSSRSDLSQEPCRKRPRVSVHQTDSVNSQSKIGKEVSSTCRKRSRRIEFDFSDGVLVRAMRAGDWILLDELNLAPPELLERLVSILDAGQVPLANEQGEIVSKKDGFVMFGAMNPPTDAGKRPLPTVLRARFTEFHVGDMISKEDILDLCTHKFFRPTCSQGDSYRMSHTETQIAGDVADFYLENYEKAGDGRLEDSTGKPVRFSLRNLSRMLDFASGLQSFLQRGAEGQRRALFEGGLASFGTQLPRKSRKELSEMAQKYMLRKSGEHTSKGHKLSELISLPRNTGILTRMLHGYPVEVDDRNVGNTTGARSKFIVTPTVEKTLKDVCRVLVMGAPKLPVLLQGPTATGKTSLVRYLAEQTGNRLTRINNHEHTEISEYIGGYVASEDGSLLFSEGPLVRAARSGDWVMLDELNLAPPDVLESINRLLDDNREVLIPETGEIVKAASGFRLFATQNPPGLYGGRKELSRAFRSRFIEVHVDDLPDSDLHAILERRAAIPASFARRMVSVLRDLQMQRRSSGLFSGREGYITARDLFRWASRGPRSKEELAIHGFLLLAERARSVKERLLVRDVIRKVIDVEPEVLSNESLYAFDLNDDGNDASKQCLDFALQKLGLDRASISRVLCEQNIILTPSMRRMLTLIIYCSANAEPVLLVGATGGGKTSSCAAVANALSRQLLTVNCHRHTEASDIIGGFRPVRHRAPSSPLFEWVDGPLIETMRNGSWMLVDEINMAEDAVIERLNSVLELERTLVLSEKGTDKSSTSPEVLTAHENFRILATMNPSGDFGKKELSPALRNRFTEVWIPPPACIDDYLPIIHQRLGNSSHLSEKSKKAFILVKDTVQASLADPQDESNGAKANAPILQISVRDLTAWCDFITEGPKVCDIDPLLAAVHGARLVFLDGLSVGSPAPQSKCLESSVWQRILTLIPTGTQKNAAKARYTEGIDVPLQIGDFRGHAMCLKVDCFYVPCSSNKTDPLQDRMSAFSFHAPNTLRNTARIARAICVGYRPILLEGPPGSGKSSLIAALASTCGFKYLRINLSECTEISDLIGCDAPGQDQGSFVFRPGPLLEALVDGSWVLLDELNLASQSVLEGLNSVLDHRKTVFVPELNEEIHAHSAFRVFGAQNSAADGGGRRGLPKSFLNRFTRVQIEAPSKNDIETIAGSIHPQLCPKVIAKIIECLEDLQQSMKETIKTTERFGLRDALRWCDLLSGIGSGNHTWGKEPLSPAQHYAVFDVAVLRSLQACERRDAELCFERSFGYSCEPLRTTPSLRPCGKESFRIGFGTIMRLDARFVERDSRNRMIPLEISRCWELQALSFAINACWPVALFSPSSSTAQHDLKRVLQQVATLYGKRVHVFDGASLTDADDFVGGYVQHDAVASMRMILSCSEELLRKVINLTGTDHTDARDRYSDASREMYVLHKELQHLLEVSVRSEQRMARSLPEFLRCSRVIIDRMLELPVLAEKMRCCISMLQKHQEDLEGLERSIKRGDFAPFKWRKSDLMNAIETGEWILIQDAEACPPALLDRLNPIFERAAVSANTGNYKDHDMTLSPMILAEAPSNEDGSPVLLQPHPHFRMFFVISGSTEYLNQCGLSRALLDRSLKIRVEVNTSSHDRGALAAIQSLSRDHWINRIDKEEKKASGSSFYRVVSDPLTLSARVRFSRAIHDSQLNDRSFAKETDKNGDSSMQVFCAGGLPHDLDDIPCTSVVVYIDNPELDSTERDLASLRILERAPTKAFDHLSERLRKILESSPIMRDRNPQGLWNQKLLRIEVVKKELCLSGADAFLFGSTSEKNLTFRAEILRARATHFGSSATAVYTDCSDAAFRFISSMDSLIRDAGGNQQCAQLAAPPDPLFGMDRVPVHSSARKINDVKQPQEYCSKRLRAEVRALHKLRATWNQAEKTASDGSFFVRAKLTYTLQRRNLDPTDVGGCSLEFLAFDLVTSAVHSIDGYCELIRTCQGWECNHEEDWMRFYTQATVMCELMTGCKETTPSSVAAILYNAASALQVIDDRGTEYFAGRLEELYCHLQPLRSRLNNLLQRYKRPAIPISELGQNLEIDFIKAAGKGRRRKLSVTQIDAVISGLATLTMKSSELDTGVLAELRKVVEFLVETPLLDCPGASPLDHWSRVVSQTGVKATQDAIIAAEAQLLDRSSNSSQSKEVLSAITYCVNCLKCLPQARMSSVAFMQKLRWVLESAAVDQTETSCPKQWLSAIDAVASLSLLFELNSLLEQEHALDDERSLKGQGGVGAFSITLRLAQRSSAVPFWSLLQASAEAACASALLLSGRHRIDHVGASSRKLLHKCFRSAVYQDRVINSALTDNRNYAQIFKSAEVALPRLGENCGRSSIQDDLAPTVQCAVSQDSTLSGVEQLLRFSKAWVAVGLGHLDAYHTFIKNNMGIDPAAFCLSATFLALENVVSTAASCLAFDVFARHRLGGDSFQKSVPAQRFLENENVYTDLLWRASSGHVFRSHLRNSYESYESFVDMVQTVITKRILDNALLSKLHAYSSSAMQEHVAQEAVHLARSCAALSSSLECEGSFGHFRDISTFLQLGLQEIQYGLSLFVKASDKSILSISPQIARQKWFFSDLMLFPRAAHKEAKGALDTLKLCMKQDVDGNFIMATANYLLAGELYGSDEHWEEISLCLSEIVSEWKKRTEADEREIEKKESLHVLREVGQKDMIPGVDILERLELDEEADFVSTFNPLTQDEEEELWGISLQNSQPVLKTNEVQNEENKEDAGRQINHESFWCLHRKTYPAHRQKEGATSHPSERAEQISVLASHLFSVASGLIPTIDDTASVWETFASERILQMHAISFSVTSLASKEHFAGPSDLPYNFYTDANMKELLQASRVLQALRNALTRIQETSFRETGRHPVLEEVEAAIRRIAKICKANTPLSRIILGLENVMRKADEWQRLFATSETRLDSYILDVGKLIARWRRLEVQSWPLLLQGRLSACETQASRWIFLLYDAIVHEGVQSVNVDSCSTKAVIASVDQFLRSSTLGEFSTRLDMVLSLGTHVLTLSGKSSKHTERLGRCLTGLGEYYGLFLSGVRGEISDSKGIVDRELAEFTRLVSWSASHDLGSSVKMVKEKDKYLEYYRLKTTAEKTRRKLHKLCLKVDAIMRAPVHESLSAQLSKLGFFRSIGDDDSSKHIAQTEMRFSERIKIGIEQISTDLQPDMMRRPNSTRKTDWGRNGSLLSNVNMFEEKLTDLGRQLASLNTTNCDLATKLCMELRSTMRERITQLRDMGVANIQMKKRALTDLLKALQKTGISPFERSTLMDAHQWLSSPEPSSCAAYNTVANELFWKSALQIQRLREVSDSRVRNPDLSNDDASKLRALCQSLFENLCGQREVLNVIFGEAEKLLSEIAAHNRLSLGNETPIKPKGTTKMSDRLSLAFCKLRRMLVDLTASEEIFKRIVKELGHTRSTLESSKSQANFLIHMHSKDFDDTLGILQTVLSSSIAAVRETEATMEKLTSLETNFVKDCRSIDGPHADAFLQAKEKLLGLVKVLDENCSKAMDISPDNFVTLVLDPVRSFAREELDLSRSNQGQRLQTARCDFEKIWPELTDEANAVIKTALISSQRILAWNDLNVSSEGLLHISGHVMHEEDNLKGLLRPGLMKTANAKLQSLSSALNISGLRKILQRIAKLINNHSETITDKEDMKKLVCLEQVIARFAARYFNSMLIPCLQRASEFHAHSLSLLRSVSSVFIGLCVEGFCRPPEQGNESGVSCDIDERQGAGFGEVGDGDMSHAQNVSDQIEDEEQLLGLRSDLQKNNDDPDPSKGENQDHDGFEMSTDFDGELHDTNGEEEEINEEQNEDDGEMAQESGIGDNIIDQRIWGDSDKPKNENQTENMDAKQTEKLGANDEKTEFVAKREGDLREDEGRGDGKCEEQICAQVSDKEDDGGLESGFDEENERDNREADDDSREENLPKPKNENPFDNVGDADKTEGGPERVHETSSRPEHTNKLPETESFGNDFENDGGFNSDGTSDEPDDPNLETKSLKSDASDGDEGNKDAMLGVQHSLPTDHTNDAAEVSSVEPTDLPADVDLEDVSDPEVFDQEDKGNSAADDQNIDSDSTRSNPEEVPAAIGEHSAETDDREASANADDGLTSDQQMMNLSREQRPLMTRPENGNMEAGNEVKMDENERTARIQPGRIGEQIDDVGPPAQDDNTDLNSATQGSALQGNRTTTDKPVHGVAREKLGEDPSGSSGDNSFRLDPNPLRISRSEELVKEWKRHLQVMEKEQHENAAAEPSPRKHDETDNLWEYQGAKESSENDMHALGAATEDQQHPLNVQEEEDHLSEDSTKDRNPGRAKRDEEYSDAPPAKNIEMERVRQDRGEEGNEIRQDASTNVEENEVSLKAHPVRAAVDLDNDRTTFQNLNSKKPSAVPGHGDVSDPMDMDEVEETEEANASLPHSNDKLAWQMETLHDDAATELWHRLELKVSSSATILCEQLRLVLEPTVTTGLSGGYRTGKRLNMRRVIEYVASDFQKDRIWLRRVKPDKRSYDVLIAIDDSASMAESEAGAMAIESLALVLSALSRLEIGRVSIVRFGEQAEMIRDFNEPLPVSAESGGELLQKFSFSQRHTDVVNLLSFIRERMGCSLRLGDGDHISLAFVISDGRLSNRDEVRRQLRHLKESSILIAFVIVDQVLIDQPSIYDVKRVDYDKDGNVSISPYMEDFPIDFYTTVQDVRSLPFVLGDALRQWIEAANA